MMVKAEACAVYARYSSHNQNDTSIEQQVAECQRYAAANGLQVVKVYADRAVSGTTDKRPEFQRMLAESSGGAWTVLLTWKLDRFARNRYDCATYKYLLRKNGVRVLYVKESIPDGPEGILLESILEGSAEYYSANLSQNVRRGMRANAEAGKLNGPPPFGYTKGEDGRPVIDDDQAAIVLEVFRRVAAGDTLPSVAGWVNSMGVATKRGLEWSVNTVRCIVKNRAYIGEYRSSGVVRPGGFPAIVDQALWESVRARFAARRSPGPRPKSGRAYILTGFARCGICGSSMSGQSMRSRHFYYECRSYYNGKGCGLKLVRADELEGAVLRAITDALLLPGTVEWIADRVIELQARDDTDGPLPELRARLAETETAVGNVMKAIEAGIFTRTTRDRLAALEAECDALRAEIHAETDRRPRLERDAVIFWLEQFRDGDVDDPAVRRRLISTLVYSVEVFRDRAVIRFNWTGEDPGTDMPEDSWGNLTSVRHEGDMVITMMGPLLMIDVPFVPGAKPKG